MTKITVKAKSFDHLVKLLEKELGPRTYYLHTRCGSKDWSIYYSFPDRNFTIEFKDARIATWISLKLEHSC
jgi:hypothetical protein